jgi:ribokinase
MADKEIEVVGLGALNMDHLYQLERILVDGETVVNKAILAPGGSAANTIYGLARLGINTGFVGAVGDDTEGGRMTGDFEEVGVDTSQIRARPGARTGATLCLSDRQGSRSIYVVPGANSSLIIEDIDMSYINNAKIVHISSFVDDEQFRITVQITGRLSPNVGLSFSPGALYVDKGMESLSPILSRTRILFINRQEIEQLTGEDFIKGAESCLRQGCQMVAVTLGKGARLKNAVATSYIKDAENEYVVEPASTDTTTALETTGAGDAFATGFLYGLLKKKSPLQCGQIGDISAKFSIARMGAREGFPTLSELSQRYQQLHNQSL